MTSESIRLQFTDKELQFDAAQKGEKKEREEEKKFIEAIRKEIDSSMKIICSPEHFFRRCLLLHVLPLTSNALPVQQSMKYIKQF